MAPNNATTVAASRSTMVILAFGGFAAATVVYMTGCAGSHIGDMGPSSLYNLYVIVAAVYGMLAFTSGASALLLYRDVIAFRFVVVTTLFCAAVCLVLVAYARLAPNEPSIDGALHVVEEGGRRTLSLLLATLCATAQWMFVVQARISQSLAPVALGAPHLVAAQLCIIFFFDIAPTYVLLWASRYFYYLPGAWAISLAPLVQVPLVAARLKVWIARVSPKDITVGDPYWFLRAFAVCLISFRVALLCSNCAYVVGATGPELSESLLLVQSIFLCSQSLWFTHFYSQQSFAKREATRRADYLAKLQQRCIHDVRNLLQELACGLEDIQDDYSTLAAAAVGRQAQLRTSGAGAFLPPAPGPVSVHHDLELGGDASLLPMRSTSSDDELRAEDIAGLFMSELVSQYACEQDVFSLFRHHAALLLRAHAAKTLVAVKDGATMLSETLDSAALQNGKLTLRLTNVQLASLASQLVNRLSNQARRGGVLLSHALSPAAAELGRVRLDPARISAVLLNLLANGVKFATIRPLSPTSAREPMHPSSGAVSLSVDVVPSLRYTGDVEGASHFLVDQHELDGLGSPSMQPGRALTKWGCGGGAGTGEIGSSSPTSLSPAASPFPSGGAASSSGVVSSSSGVVSSSSSPSLVFLRFTVTDNGPGIAADEIPRLRGEFVQTSAGEKFEHSSGLGLSIVCTMVRLLKGTVSLSSDVRARCTAFRVTVPAAVVQKPSSTDDASSSPPAFRLQPPPALPAEIRAAKDAGMRGAAAGSSGVTSSRSTEVGAGGGSAALWSAGYSATASSYSLLGSPASGSESPAPVPGPSLSSPLVALVVEDSPLIRRVVAKHLARALPGVLVHEAGDGAAALRCVVEQAGGANSFYSVIIMDGTMPIMDGYEATARLRERGYTGPILAVTGDERGAQRFAAAGADLTIVKPYAAERFIDSVRTFVRRGAAVPAPGAR